VKAVTILFFADRIMSQGRQSDESDDPWSIILYDFVSADYGNDAAIFVPPGYF